MRFTEWKEIAELIGLVAIVASLVFVGLQLKQSQEIALATQYQSRTEAVQSLVLAHIESDYVPFIPALRRGVDDGVPVGDIHTVHWLWIQMDNHYYQYQSGFLDEQSWAAQLRNTQELFSFCALRFVYDWRKKGLRDEFVNLVASFDDPCAGS